MMILSVNWMTIKSSAVSIQVYKLMNKWIDEINIKIDKYTYGCFQVVLKHDLSHAENRSKFL